MRIARNIALFVWFMLPPFSSAQGVSFTATVDRTQVAAGDQIELTITLTGSTGGKNFRPPSFPDFALLSGPNQSTNMQFVNGQVSSSISYAYVLQPKAEGKFTIGPAAIEYDGKQLTTQPVTITVAKGAARPKQQAQQSDDADVGRQIGDNLFLRAQVDKSRIYQGEQLTVTYKIYTRVSVVNYGLTKVPALTGFWSEDLEVPKQIQLTTETINGKQYRVGVLKKSALFPQRSGTLDLDAMEVDCVVQMQSKKRSNDVFDQFFNDPFFGNVRNINYKVRSEPVKITVMPLPSANLPASFSGAVGKFTFEAWLDKRETKTNDPVTLKVKITGRGNLKLLEAPPVTVPPDIERYDPKIADNLTHQGDQLSGSRTFEFLLIPRHAGEQRIPPIAFSYFDLEKKNYATVKSPEFVLHVEKGSDVPSGPVAGFGKEDVKLLGEDVRFIKSDHVSFHRRGEIFYGSPLFFILSIGPGIVFFGFLFVMRRRERVSGDINILRNRRARKMARKRLVEAKKLLDAGKKEEFYAEISRAVWGYLSDKLTIPPSDLSVDMLRSVLQRRNVSVESVAAVAETLEQCEFARFAPAQDAVRMDAMYRQAVDVVAAIEDQLR